MKHIKNFRHVSFLNTYVKWKHQRYVSIGSGQLSFIRLGSGLNLLLPSFRIFPYWLSSEKNNIEIVYFLKISTILEQNAFYKIKFLLQIMFVWVEKTLKISSDAYRTYVNNFSDISSCIFMYFMCLIHIYVKNKMFINICVTNIYISKCEWVDFN